MKIVISLTITLLLSLGCSNQEAFTYKRKGNIIEVVNDSEYVVTYKGATTKFSNVQSILVRDGIPLIETSNGNLYQWDSLLSTDAACLQNSWPYVTFIFQHSEGAEWAGTSLVIKNKNTMKKFYVGDPKKCINFEYYGFFNNWFVIENGLDSFSVIDTIGTILATHPWPHYK
jgi:hypothetical protein